MKVMVKSDRVPIVLLIMGLGMSVVSQYQSLIDDNRSTLFILGWAIALTGFLLWAIPAINKLAKKREKIRRRMEGDIRDEDADQHRRYARSRR